MNYIHVIWTYPIVKYVVNKHYKNWRFTMNIGKKRRKHLPLNTNIRTGFT